MFHWDFTLCRFSQLHPLDFWAVHPEAASVTVMPFYTFSCYCFPFTYYFRFSYSLHTQRFYIRVYGMAWCVLGFFFAFVRLKFYDMNTPCLDMFITWFFCCLIHFGQCRWHWLDGNVMYIYKIRKKLKRGSKRAKSNTENLVERARTSSVLQYFAWSEHWFHLFCHESSFALSLGPPFNIETCIVLCKHCTI